MVLPTDASGQVRDPMIPQIARIRRRWRDGPEIWTLDLLTEDDGIAPFVPGQFNMLTVFGVGEVPISVSGDPADGGHLLHTVRAVGPVSAALADLRPGAPVGIRGPFGTGWPVEEITGRDILLIAGGLGLAPLRPAVCRLLAERGRYGTLTLIYGTRSPDDILFHRELQSWRRRTDFDVQITVDHATKTWGGHVGVVTTLLPRATFDPSRTTALICGPEVMMRFAVNALRSAGLDEKAIFLSMERNMKCAIGLCGHCQFGTVLVCRDGPVFSFDRIRGMLGRKEL